MLKPWLFECNNFICENEISFIAENWKKSPNSKGTKLHVLCKDNQNFQIEFRNPNRPKYKVHTRKQLFSLIIELKRKFQQLLMPFSRPGLETHSNPHLCLMAYLSRGPKGLKYKNSTMPSSQNNE